MSNIMCYIYIVCLTTITHVTFSVSLVLHVAFKLYSTCEILHPIFKVAQKLNFISEIFLSLQFSRVERVTWFCLCNLAFMLHMLHGESVTAKILRLLPKVACIFQFSPLMMCLPAYLVRTN